MGKMVYDGNLSVDFDDRTLAHLQVVMGVKLRRKESFYFSWRDDPSIGDGRNTIWIQDSISLRFKFFGSRVPQLNRAWVEALTFAANSSSGLVLVAEPPDRSAHSVPAGAASG